MIKETSKLYEIEVKREEFSGLLPCQEEILHVKELGSRIRDELLKTKGTKKKAEFERKILNWLYVFARKKIKRGPVFELNEVLAQGCADCLGYAKLLKSLGAMFGLDVGIVDVVIDNAGRNVPHQVNILKLADRRWQLIDLWYGSRNINHRRIGARVKEEGKWKVRDIDKDKFDEVKDIKGLSEGCIEGIDYYILGNRHLNRGEFNEAIACYTKGIKLYPQNARLYFNRAIAYDAKGEYSKAKRDYSKAMQNEGSLIRILAREHEEITRLIELDRKNLNMLQL